MNVYDVVTRMQNNTNRINYDRGREMLGSDKLDKHAFLQLLMAKLQHQDPLNPVKDADFLNQQAMLAQVEKLDELSKVMQTTSLLSQAGSLVGKKVDVRDAFGNLTTGVIDSATFADGTAGLSVNGEIFSIDQVVRIHSS